MPSEISDINSSSNINNNFFNKILKKENGCWIWTGATDKRGYGRFAHKYKTWLAHRYSYFIHIKDPEKNLVCHKCDTPSCVNPEHLFLGSYKDNHQDMVRKQRYNGMRKGHNYYYVYKPDVIRKVVEHLESSLDTVTEAAKKFNVDNRLCYRWIKQAGFNPKKYAKRKRDAAIDFYLRNKISLRELSKKFNISRSVISDELRNRTIVK